MNCFGDIEKISIVCDDSFKKYHCRYVPFGKNKEIIFTESPNLFTKYNIHKHLTPIQSWSFQELNKLYAPIAFTNNNGVDQFFGIHSGNTFIEWTFNETNQLCEVFKKNFKYLLIDILLYPHMKEPVLIFSNGWVEFLNNVKSEFYTEDLNKPIIRQDEEIIGIESLTSKKDRLVIYYIVTNQNKSFFIYKCTFKNGTIIRTEISEVNHKLDTWKFYSFNGNLIGASKINNLIKVFSLEPPIKTNNYFFEFESSSFDKLFSMAICKSGAICFLGEKYDGDFVMDVYEASYLMKIGSLNLNKTVLPNDFCSIGDNIFITCHNNIIMVPIVNQKLLLSQLLTKNLMFIPDDNDNHIKTANYQEFKEKLGILNVDESLSIEKIQEINNKFKLIKDHQEIPEEIIVSLLDFCTKQYLQLTNDDDNQIKKGLKKFFTSLFSLPYNEIFLVSCLKSSNISIDQYLLSIELLLDLLPCENCSPITWISVFLDVNYNKFIIRPSPKVIEALYKIYDQVCQSIEFFQNLGTIKSLIESIVKREGNFLSALTEESGSIGQYSIELLTFF